MNTNVRKLIKNINSGKNLDKDLPVYASILTEQYKNDALLQTTMDYYVICEQYAEGFFKEKEVKETVEFIHQMISEIFLNEEEYHTDACIEKVEAERTKVIRKMEVLTNYTDQLMVYEYMLNRLEHKFDQAVCCEDDTVFAQQLLQYIMGVKDNYIVNEKIKDVIGQLPVRMARSKFFERIKNSIFLYKGSEKESLDGYLYMLRTSGTLYKPEGEGLYFEDWGRFVDRLETVDYENLNQTEYNALFDELKEKASDISNASEVFVTLQELINTLYVYLLMDNKKEDNKLEEEFAFCKEIIREIASHAVKGEEIPDEEGLMEKLQKTEGIQEEIMMNILSLTGSLQMLEESQQDIILELELQDVFKNFKKSEDLLSSSVFVEFKDKFMEEVTDKMAEEETAKLVAEFSQLFKEKPIRFVRAVIACTISRMPVFFTGVEELSEYIQASLEQCKDDAEKLASYELLKGIMEED